MPGSGPFAPAGVPYLFSKEMPLLALSPTAPMNDRVGFLSHYRGCRFLLLGGEELRVISTAVETARALRGEFITATLKLAEKACCKSKWP
jgi:hypothetical protein